MDIYAYFNNNHNIIILCAFKCKLFTKVYSLKNIIMCTLEISYDFEWQLGWTHLECFKNFEVQFLTIIWPLIFFMEKLTSIT
jgi:hypothetical protein